MRIEILSLATEHIADGYWFYENQSEGLGSHFRSSILANIRHISVTAGVHQIHFEKYFRSISKTFPFAIYYQINDEVIEVWAVIDCRKDPDWITEQLM